jgi:branched-subunit amino acid permease
MRSFTLLWIIRKVGGFTIIPRTTFTSFEIVYERYQFIKTEERVMLILFFKKSEYNWNSCIPLHF